MQPQPIEPRSDLAFGLCAVDRGAVEPLTMLRHWLDGWRRQRDDPSHPTRLADLLVELELIDAGERDAIECQLREESPWPARALPRRRPTPEPAELGSPHIERTRPAGAGTVAIIVAWTLLVFGAVHWTTRPAVRESPPRPVAVPRAPATPVQLTAAQRTEAAARIRLADDDLASGDLDAAISGYTWALNLDPTRADAHRGRAWALLAAGLREAARVDARRAFDLDSSSEDTRLLLKRLGEEP